MSYFLSTVLVAFIVLLIGLLGMAVGWFVTGRVRIGKGCGMDPNKLRDGSCDEGGCSLCKPEKKDEE